MGVVWQFLLQEGVVYSSTHHSIKCVLEARFEV